jgi:hypothetical protein
VPGFWRIVLVIATAATGAGIAGLRAQTALMDPKDSKTIFATTCTACHKSPQGLAKSGQVAGFLRQHYTTGPEMSAAMAAYLVAAGPAPAASKKKDGAAENAAAKAKAKKQEQAELSQPGADAKDRNARGKQRQAKQTDEPSPARPAAPAAEQPAASAAEPVRQAAAAPSAAVAAAAPAPAAATPAPPAPAEPLVTFDLPLPPMPDGPPADLINQTGFSSSPVP